MFIQCKMSLIHTQYQHKTLDVNIKPILHGNDTDVADIIP